MEAPVQFFKTSLSKIHSSRVPSFLQIPAAAATLSSALHSNFCGTSVICLGLSFLCHCLGNGSQAGSLDNHRTHFMSFLSFKYCKLALFVVLYFKKFSHMFCPHGLVYGHKRKFYYCHFKIPNPFFANTYDWVIHKDIYLLIDIETILGLYSDYETREPFI